MKKKISKKHRNIENVMLITGVILTCKFRFIFEWHRNMIDILLAFGGIFLICFAVIMIRNMLVIEFDDNYLYMTRGKKSIILPLSQITDITRAFSGRRGPRYWRLIYIDMDGKRFSVHFAELDDESLKEFIETAKKRNPRLNIRFKIVIVDGG